MVRQPKIPTGTNWVNAGLARELGFSTGCNVKEGYIPVEWRGTVRWASKPVVLQSAE